MEVARDSDAQHQDLSTLMRPRPATVTVRAPRFALSVVRGETPGTAFIVDGENPSRVYMGSSPACGIHLPDRHASRRHAALDVHGDRLRVIDLHSTNGTTVDSIQVAEAYLRGGEMLTIGETVLRVTVVDRDATVTLSPATSFGRVVGASAEMRRLYPLCERLAASDLPVVIEGETGTGKELLAESLHENSARSAGPLVVFDCAATRPNVTEALLFGCESGALYAGSSEKIGLFEAANGGTLLIDEVGDLPLEIQPKLLRAIARSEVRRVGAASARHLDVRIIATTRRDLEREIQDGKFRDDLFFRLAAARVELPPLRDRRGDVRLLANHFWERFGHSGAPTEDTLRAFDAHRWPGNVRELENAVARAAELGELSPQLEIPKSPSATAPTGTARDFLDEVIRADLALPAARQRVVDEFLRRYVEDALAKQGGNVARAAAASGVARRYFQILRLRGTK
jgi:DNA-binding NtrC family response regulator